MTIFYNIFGLRRIILLLQNIYFKIIFGSIFRKRVVVYGLPIIKKNKYSSITAGENLMLISASYFSEPGVNHPVIIRTLRPKAEIIIGKNVGISGGCICSASKIEIGDDVLIGANTSIADTDFHPTEPVNRRISKENIITKPVKIGNNVFIGMNSIIMKGVVIGDNSIIGAGSIVTTDIPCDSIAAGIPAKVIRKIQTYK